MIISSLNVWNGFAVPGFRFAKLAALPFADTARAPQARPPVILVSRYIIPEQLGKYFSVFKH